MKVGTCDLAEIGARMKVARAALGLTQAQLADAVDGSKPGIQDNEAGKSMPGGKVICGLVRLGINANWLLTGEGPMLLADLRPKGPLDPALMRLAIEELQAWQERNRRLLPAAKIADALELLVSIAQGDPERLKSEAQRILRLVA